MTTSSARTPTIPDLPAIVEARRAHHWTPDPEVDAVLAYTEALQAAAVKWRDALDRHQRAVDDQLPALSIEFACNSHRIAQDELRALLPPEPNPREPRLPRQLSRA